MKATLAGLVFVFTTAVAFAQPDPRDSIILESKTVNPGAHPGAASDTGAYLYVKVYITNKDTLITVVLALQESSVSGGAYATLGRPRSFNGMVNRLTNTLRSSSVSVPNTGTTPGRYYNSASPDSLLLAGIFDPGERDLEPPNPIRKPFWELKFDSVWNNLGTFELDTAFVLQNTGFTNYSDSAYLIHDIPVNFVKSVVTVVPKGDLNADFSLSSADAVWLLGCVFLGTVPPAGMAACDLNCDGLPSPADVALELNAIYLGGPFPC